MSKAICKRCGDKTPTINNLIETSFYGLLKAKTLIETTRKVGVTSSYIKGHGINTRVLTTDEDYDLCSNCWSDFVGNFMKGREVRGL